jgi:hypothetical protein
MKTVRIALIVAGVGTIVALGVVAYAMFWGPDRLDLAGKSLSQLFEQGDLVPLVVIPVVLIISGIVIVPVLRTLFPSEIKNGVNAPARVLQVWDTGVTINDNPQVGLLLEVSPAGAMPFQARAKTIVSRLNVALVQPGVAAEVRFDPKKPQRLRILTLHVQGTSAADAATRMEQLNELRDKGLITESEYREKRQEILKSL